MARLSDDWYDRMFELLMRQDQEDAEVILDKIADAANRKKAAEAEAEKRRAAAQKKSTDREDELVQLIMDFDKWERKWYGSELGKTEPMTESAARGVAKVVDKLMSGGYFFGL